MRMSDQAVQVVRDTVKELVGNSVVVRLFGSRVDDSAKGGDIDLYVASSEIISNRASMAARIAARLQQRLGDQRIDVVLTDPQTPRLPIHEVAEKTGIRL